MIAVMNTGSNMVHELAVCTSCRIKRYHGSIDALVSDSLAFRKSTFDITEITVRILAPGTPAPSPDSYSEEQTARRAAESVDPPTLITYGSKKKSGLRQSRRIREVKERGKQRRVTITSHMSVRDLKVLASTFTSNGPSHTLDVLISFPMSSGFRSSPSDCSTVVQSFSTAPQRSVPLVS